MIPTLLNALLDIVLIVTLPVMTIAMIVMRSLDARDRSALGAQIRGTRGQSHDQGLFAFHLSILVALLVVALVLLVQTLAAQAVERAGDLRRAGPRHRARHHRQRRGLERIYGADGRVAGRTTTDSSGSIVVYDAQGRTAARIPTQRSKP